LLFAVTDFKLGVFDIDFGLGFDSRLAPIN
jgi:hypothetical protein